MHHAPVADRLGPLMDEGLVATCALVDLEILFSARSLRDYEHIRAERRAFDSIAITEAVMDRAREVQHALACRGQHRTPIPDVIISAVSASAGLTLLHYDADFELIAAVTKLSHDWVVPPGTV